MNKTATVTELRNDLASFLSKLDEGPVVVLSRSRPVAVLVQPAVFDALLEKLEYLEDVVEGRRAAQEFRRNPRTAVDAEETFSRLGL
jgi:prevent-host-death family protein